MTTAKVSELKAKLSGYLSDVRRGATITVCDRQTPIAKLVPIDEEAEGLEVREAEDSAVLPTGPPIPVCRHVDVLALLREERDAK